MKWTYIKIIIKEIRQSFGRFMAIFGIVTLGVGFLSGLLITTPDMHYSVDDYYDKYNMSDVVIKGTLGITKEDIKEIEKIPEVDAIMPAYVNDTLMIKNKTETITTRVYGLPFLKNEIEINQLQLLEGRLPQKDTECVVERQGSFISPVPIGSKVSISDENKNYDDIDDIYHTKEFTVVGVVSNTYYFSLEREYTNVGSGQLDAIIYVDERCFSMDVYTDLYLTVKNTLPMDAFSEEYENTVDVLTKKLEPLGKERAQIRYDDVYEEATEKLAEGTKEYDDGKIESEHKLSDAKKELDDGEKELADALEEIKKGQAEIQDAKTALKNETAEAKKEIEDNKVKLQSAFLKLQSGEKDLEKAWKELEDGQKKYDAGYANYLLGKKELDDAQSAFDTGEQEYQKGLLTFQNGKKELQDGEKTISDSERKLQEGQREYNEGRALLNANKARLFQSVSPYLSYLPYSTAEELFAAIDKGSTSATESFDAAVVGAAQSTLIQIIQKYEEQIAAQTSFSSKTSDNSSVVNTKSTLSAQISYLSASPSLDLLEKRWQELKSQLPNPNYETVLLEQQYVQMPKTSAVFLESWQQIKPAEQQLNQAELELINGRTELLKGKEELRSAREKIQASEIELASAKVEIDKNRITLKNAWQELDNGKKELDLAKNKLEAGLRKYNIGKNEIIKGLKEYQDGMKKLEEAEKTLTTETTNAEKKIKKAEQSLQDGIRKYDQGISDWTDGEKEYLDAKIEVEEELSEAEQEIEDARQEIEALETPKWYILDRNSNMSYASFVMNAEKVAAISKVFPVFFYLISALVALTTMTRMVEEERLQLGTLKSLGYSKAVIISKYLVYCGAASILGSVVGIFIGLNLMPYVIWNAYGVMYHLPDFKTQFDPMIVFLSSGMSIFSTMLATVYAVSNSLKEKPAVLLQPKAPKAGKRILLERVGFVWSRMSFNQKSTARNLFRYKKHFFMTIIGIGGCTALLMAGFGLRDSISTIIDEQFDNIFKYDIVLDLDDAETRDDELQDILKDTEKIEDFTPIFKEKSKLLYDGEEYNTTILVPLKPKDINQFINLKNREEDRPLQFENSSIIITEKIAETLHLNIGDTITLDNEDDLFHLKITGITENYLGNYVYLSQNVYEKTVGERISTNGYLIKTPSESSENPEDLLSTFLSTENVLSAELISNSQDTFNNLLHSINYIVIVIIIASGALAFIVLYNLTNINVNERKKELATLKVLGFYNNEVANYIFRETIILTILGIAVGLLFGKVFHSFIIFTIENIDFMFGRKIFIGSYILSTLITLLFSLIVNIFMYKKIKNIQMVDSMKAID